MLSAMRLLRTIHGWMGIIAIPWVLMYGLTGLYLNHEGQFNALLGDDPVDSYWSEDAPNRLPTEAVAREWLEERFPGMKVNEARDEPYHGKDAFIFEAGRTSVIAPKNSTYYFVKDAHARRLHDASGATIHTRRYWQNIFKELHVRGWVGSPFGTLIADTFGIILVSFGISGTFLWLVPRLLRMRARRSNRSLSVVRN